MTWNYHSTNVCGSLVWAGSVLGSGEEVRVPALQELIVWRRGMDAKGLIQWKQVTAGTGVA